LPPKQLAAARGRQTRRHQPHLPGGQHGRPLSERTPALTPSAPQHRTENAMTDTRTQREIEIAADLMCTDTSDTDGPF
jgi:hypothetical protein